MQLSKDDVNMTTATVTSKEQITIPANVRAKLHVSTGDRVQFVLVGEGRFEIIAATKDVKNIRGMIKTNKVVTIEEMDKAILEEAGKL